MYVLSIIYGVGQKTKTFYLSSVLNKIFNDFIIFYVLYKNKNNVLYILHNWSFAFVQLV